MTDQTNIKCIAFDLDDTILTTQKTLSERTQAALKKALELGIAVVPVSGRPMTSFPECITEFPGLHHAVTSNGAAVYDMQTREKIHGCLMEAKDVRAIMKGVGNFFLEGQITYEAFVDGVAYASADYIANPTAFGISPNTVDYIQKTRRPERYIIDFIFEHASKMDSLGLILKDAGLYRMVENSVKRNAEQVYITSAIPNRLEISAKDSGKANGLRYVLEQLGVAPEETVAFGDASNDADMLKYAGTGVAVGNANVTCKESADIVMKETANEDAVAAYLEEHVL